ncbi:RagB/SusD family nutrient uptake outer membrane protein [Pararcticibacter amylolyticus]|uniref:RagB/SusD family nutrient uptake outer membrane protein n=1 Tax=Pararcticibacter amylolyticus TaxID=2173175 RepID=A0A2U2PMR4_9SPHI|nr:RagB/SusD family nutrient uptake outer membrane protein [Pararcticibacter amylolyticus]PWG82680.1 RagB/SusD family nutrient uptake outer membrane protein [Pararcticibacter amylolyticus]
MKKLLSGALLLVLISASSCKKYLDITPVGRVMPETTEDFRALLTSAYSLFPEFKGQLALRTDELIMNEYSEDAVYSRDIFTWKDGSADPATTEFPYQSFYQSVFYATEIITSAEEKAGKSAEVDQIRGEAYLLRAYCHFELLNLYAKPYNKETASTDRGVPVSTEIDLEKKFAPAPTESVYSQIFSDIEKAEELINITTFETGKNYRFTRRAMEAFKARIYEYRGEWEKALSSAEKALAFNNQLEDLNNSNLVPTNFLSAESIVALESTLPSLVSRAVYVSPDLISKYQAGSDLRLTKFYSKSGSRYNSLKTGSDQFKVTFRNAEMYLIKAEAAFQTGNTALARETLLALKAKRFTPQGYITESAKVAQLSGPALLSEILAERTRELALEGHRWYDLRRYGQPSITHQFNGETFVLQQNDPRYTLRFPASAIQNNPNLQ